MKLISIYIDADVSLDIVIDRSIEMSIGIEEFHCFKTVKLAEDYVS